MIQKHGWLSPGFCVGIQEGLSQPVALLLNEEPSTIHIANAHGFRYFTGVDSFQKYVRENILSDGQKEVA